MAQCTVLPNWSPWQALSFTHYTIYREQVTDIPRLDVFVLQYISCAVIELTLVGVSSALRYYKPVYMHLLQGNVLGHASAVNSHTESHEYLACKGLFGVGLKWILCSYTSNL